MPSITPPSVCPAVLPPSIHPPPCPHPLPYSPQHPPTLWPSLPALAPSRTSPPRPSSPRTRPGRIGLPLYGWYVAQRLCESSRSGSRLTQYRHLTASFTTRSRDPSCTTQCLGGRWRPVQDLWLRCVCPHPLPALFRERTSVICREGIRPRGLPLGSLRPDRCLARAPHRLWRRHHVLLCHQAARPGRPREVLLDHRFEHFGDLRRVCPRCSHTHSDMNEFLQVDDLLPGMAYRQPESRHVQLPLPLGVPCRESMTSHSATQCIIAHATFMYVPSS